MVCDETLSWYANAEPSFNCDVDDGYLGFPKNNPTVKDH